MRIRQAAFLIMLASSLALAGCIGKVKYPTYYALQLAPSAAAQPGSTNQAATASIAIREFRSPEYLRRGAIVYRPSPEEIAFYDYHRWATEPPRTITEAVADRLRAGGSFTHVKMYDGRSDVDYILTGKLEKLDEIDFQGGVQVEVALSAQLTDSRTGKTVWENSASEEAIVDKREVPAVVSAMSQAIDRTIVKLLGSLPSSTEAKNGL
ncbi:ABC-type transport auxiliary lipoprotein family protein [Acidicapsa ligni]|uniref:ABC-type transport auxiliary lipoprotein family protein n=1 Tax=Acidicapsa ligni TaxID=542300 RepID=UPI0021E00260|nr:PqiC family protein [Acidicapsa ligni]